MAPEKSEDDLTRAKDRPPRQSKKEQILGLFAAGILDVQEISALTRAKTTYVASVLKGAGHLDSYYDLYTPSRSMNVYAKLFRGKIGFRDEATALASVGLMETLYQQFAAARDRAGQHHVLVEALTMFDRARWSGKGAEATIFSDFLREKLTQGLQRPTSDSKDLH